MKNKTKCKALRERVLLSTSNVYLIISSYRYHVRSLKYTNLIMSVFTH